MLTVTEATAVNELLDYFLCFAPADSPVEDHRQCERAKDAAVLLADHAKAKLHAGVDGSKVAKSWHCRRPTLAEVFEHAE